MAEMTTGEEDALSTTGYLRAVIWFGGAALVLLVVFLFRLGTLQPNWLVLLALILGAFATGSRPFRDLLNMKSASKDESIVQIAIAVSAVLAIAAIVYFSWRYGAPPVVRVVEAYVLPACVPMAFAYAAVAFHAERKHRVRVYFGNGGWRFVPLPSNNTVEADARKSRARRSL
jgi:hypothetical protein